MQTRHRVVSIATTIALLMGWASPISGQELTRVLRVTVENDYFQLWRASHERSDDNFTQGLLLHADLAATPARVRRAWCNAARVCGSSLELGQEFYTPTEDAVDPLPGQRPYAGWLFLRGTVSNATRSRRRSIAATIGVTGRPSLAEQTQVAFHHLFASFRTPLGWSHQIGAEPDAAITIDEERRVDLPLVLSRWVEVRPVAHATVGTLRTDVGGGAMARFGIGLHHPWLTETSAPPVELSLTLGAKGAAVARDLFLDGGTFRASGHVDRELLIGSWERGLALRVRRLAIECRAVTTSREYRTGPSSHTFGGISVAWWTAL